VHSPQLYWRTRDGLVIAKFKVQAWGNVPREKGGILSQISGMST